MFTKSPSAQNPKSKPVLKYNVRLLSMELSLSHTPELLAALIAFHGLCNLSCLQSGWFDTGVGLGVRDFLERFVLVGFEPLESALDCKWISIRKRDRMG
jgi:hypothetical protein